MTDRDGYGTWRTSGSRPGWHVGPPSYDPGRGRWEIIARSPKPPGRRAVPRYVVGQALSELEALEDLAARLAG